MESDSWLIYLSIVALIGCSAFFSACETALSTFNRIRIKKKADDGDARAKKVLSISENYDKTISSVLIGNNIVNIAASTLAAVALTALFGPNIGALAATVLMTLLILAFGEILPKSYGKRYSDNVALAVCGPLSAIIWLLTPLSFLFTRFNRGIMRADVSSQPSITEEELIYMIDSIEEEGVLEEQERDLVQSALEFDEISIREILTPRVNIVAVDADDGIPEIERVIVEEGYSRIPVYEKTVDNIIGVLYSRDFFRALISGRKIDIREMMSEPLFVHKGMKLSQLLTNFKARKQNLAVVVDEYGGTLGIVTMEDVLEELVGDIWDEDDEIPSSLTQLDGDSFEAAGEHDLWDMFEQLEIDEDDVDSDFSTVGGWALHMLEHIPDIGEEFSFMGYRFTVMEMDGHRLKKLGIARGQNADGQPQVEEKDLK